jgi:inorganic triphosphatase YgiF
MADTKREIERKYESDDSGLPDLTGVAGVAAVLDKGLVELDATYYDTSDQRLTSAALTLRRRTGGTDAGWHLKVPV